MNAPHYIHVVCEARGCEGGVSTLVCEICPISFGGGEEFAMLGGVVEGCDSGN
jgi:hypothetical protein